VKLISSELDLNYAGQAPVPAGLRVVIPDSAVQSLVHACRKVDSHPRISGLGHYRRPYFGQDLAGKSLFMWRGCGVGDQLVWGGLAAILKRLFPTARIVNYSHPTFHRELWEGVRSLPFEARPEPVDFETWKSFDYHLLGEDLVESDREPDQPDVWSGHLMAAGIAGERVPADLRRPCVPVTPEDRALADRWLRERGIRTDAFHRPDRPLVLWQLAASSPVRSYRPDLTRAALARLCRELPGAAVAVTGRDADLGTYRLPEADNLWCAMGLPIRAVFALLDVAACTVAPDSCLGHAAGGLRRPCVSLWGSFLPGDRAGTYAEHRPLTGRTACSPCRHHETSALAAGCPRVATGEAQVPCCEALAQITPESIVDAVKEIVQCLRK
jgi:hypothetical protein